MRNIVTDAKAEQLRKSIARTFPDYASDSKGPIIVRDWSDNGDCVIIWEEAPYDWPVIYCELAAGYDYKDPEFGFTYKALKKPVGKVFIEPYSNCVLAVYKD